MPEMSAAPGPGHEHAANGANPDPMKHQGSAGMESYQDRINRLAAASDDVGLIRAIWDVVRAAKIELTDESIMAILSVRKEQAMLSLFEELLLNGEMGAVLAPDAPHPQGFPLNPFQYYEVWGTERLRAADGEG